MNVEPSTGFVYENEVAFPAVVATLLMKASAEEEPTKARHLRVWQRNIEVIVRSRLFAEDGVDGPPAVDVDLEGMALQKGNQFGDVCCSHGSRTGASDHEKLRARFADGNRQPIRVGILCDARSERVSRLLKAADIALHHPRVKTTPIGACR
jgi:hypothetical protein